MNIIKCYFCPSEDVKWCNLCQHYFCKDCKKRYDKRIISMIKERFAKKGKLWLTKNEYDERTKEVGR